MGTGGPASLGAKVLQAAVIVATILAATTWLNAALPTPGQSAGREWLTGQLLIAAPWMGDPRFDHTVVLVIRHDASGALGLVINRPFGEQPVARILELLGDKENPVAGAVRVFSGGPVQPEVGFVIHSSEYHRASDIEVDGRVAVTSGADLVGVLRDIGDNKGPQKSLVAFGYAGWAPGQLDYEMANHIWSTVPEEPSVIFDEDREKVWERAFLHRT